MKDFPEFFGADGAVAALFSDGELAGAANVVFDYSGKGGKDIRRIKKLSLKERFRGADTRRFFVRSLVLKLLDGEKWIYSDFTDPLLEEIGFAPFGDGMRCRSDSVRFRRMCESAVNGENDLRRKRRETRENGNFKTDGNTGSVNFENR
ncbi:MAG: hypothetical protein LBP62_03350 [Clostridiales bacterium]|nr:hypothetical protein [Clostridiales bacterium]